MAYGVDFKKRALQLREQGKTRKVIALLLGIGTATLARWEGRGENDLRPRYPKKKGAYKVNEVALVEYLKKHPDAYAREIAEAIGSKRSSVQDAMKRLGITRKKKRRNTASVMNQSATTTKS